MTDTPDHELANTPDAAFTNADTDEFDLELLQRALNKPARRDVAGRAEAAPVPTLVSEEQASPGSAVPSAEAAEKPLEERIQDARAELSRLHRLGGIGAVGSSLGASIDSEGAKLARLLDRKRRQDKPPRIVWLSKLLHIDRPE